MITIIGLICIAYEAFCNSESEIRNFMAQIDSLMNRRNIYEIEKFYEFYTDKNAVFIKESQLVDYDNPNKILATQHLQMNRSDYIKYLTAVLKTPKQYSYALAINSIEESNGNITLAINAKDTSMIDKYDMKKQTDYMIYVITLSNCNYALEYKNARYYIRGMNCLEKINRTSIYPDNFNDDKKSSYLAQILL